MNVARDIVDSGLLTIMLMVVIGAAVLVGAIEVARHFAAREREEDRRRQQWVDAQRQLSQRWAEQTGNN